MEDQRSTRSLPARTTQAGGDFDVGDDRARASSISKTAAVSVLGLVVVVGWLVLSDSGPHYVRSEDTSRAVASPAEAIDGLSAVAASSNMDMATSLPAQAGDIAMIGPAVVGTLVAQYQALKDSGSYSPEAAASAAEQLGEVVIAPVPFKKYTAQDIHTSSDNSYDAMIAYRTALKGALALMASQEEYELGVFAKYAETKDAAYLKALRGIVADYMTSAKTAASLTVPSEAVALHTNTLNAMGQFAAVLEGLADNVDDPITVMVLLRTYNEAENNVVTSFNNLAMYFAHHPQT